jgi:hypothetical protein
MTYQEKARCGFGQKLQGHLKMVVPGARFEHATFGQGRLALFVLQIMSLAPWPG